MRPKTGAKPALPQKPCFENGPGYQPTEGPAPPEGGPGPPRKDQTSASTKAPIRYNQVPRIPISFRSGSPGGSKSVHAWRTPDQDCSSRVGAASPGAQRRSRERGRRNAGGR